MLLTQTIMTTVILLGSSVRAAPTNSSSPTEARSAADGDPLEASETGHAMRRRLWRRLLKQVHGVGQGAYGLGGYGLGGSGLNFLSQIANFQSHNNVPHCCGPYRGPTAYGGVGAGVGGGYGNNVLHYPVHSVGGVSHGVHVDFPINHGQGYAASTGPGLWDSGAWGLFGNYGLGGPDGLNFDTVWL